MTEEAKMTNAEKPDDELYVYTVLFTLAGTVLCGLIALVTGIVGFSKLYEINNLDQLDVLRLIAIFLATLVSSNFARTLFQICWHYLRLRKPKKE